MSCTLKNELIRMDYESVLDYHDWIDHPPGKEEQLRPKHGEENEVVQQ